MLIFAAKNAKGANVLRLHVAGLQQGREDISAMQNSVRFNACFSLRMFAFFAAKRVCLS